MKHLLRNYSGLSVLCYFTFLCLTSHAELKEGKVYGNMPWHLADIWWKLPNEAVADGFQSIEIDVTMKGELDDDLRLYIAPFGLGTLSKTKFYGGIQTNMLAQTKSNKRRQNIGHGGIFSMWDERALEAIRPAEGGFIESSGHEGDFISIRRKVNWSEGKYTCRLQVLEEVLISAEPFSWVGYFIYDHQKDEQIYCGSLRFPGHDLKLGKNVAGFVEIFGARPDDHVIPQNMVITFSAPRVNGKEVSKPGCMALHPKGVPDVLQVACITAADDKDKKKRAVVFTFVEKEFTRDKRQYSLYELGESEQDMAEQPATESK